MYCLKFQHNLTIKLYHVKYGILFEIKCGQNIVIKRVNKVVHKLFLNLDLKSCCLI